jgi:hypothetical protein
MSADTPERPLDEAQSEVESLFDIVSYLITAARLSLDEAPRNGSARLLVGAMRLLTAAEATEGVEVDDTLRAWKRSMDENVMNVMNHYPEYTQWLGELTRDVAQEVTSRNLAG